MSLNTIDYLNLSALAYIDFKGDAKDNDIAYILKNGLYTGDLDKPELSSLKDPSNPLRSYTLINSQSNTSSGFSAAAFKSPSGEIVFAFRGTENNNGIPVWNDAITDATIGLTLVSPAQFESLQRFVRSTVAKLTDNTNISINDSLQYLRNHNTTATGHSLGGGLAQYLTYLTSNLTSGGNYGGIKSVTFNAVGIGQNLLDANVPFKLSQYNSTDHVNSLDWVGTYGLQLGNTITHIDNSEADYTKVDFDALGKMLVAKLRYDCIKVC